MRVDEYITGLRKNHNITITVEGEELKIQAQKKDLTADIVAELKARKAEILEFFKNINDKNEFRTIGKAEPKANYKLSSAQKRMYFLYELDQKSTAYNMPQVVKLEGELDIARLSNAFTQLLNRHETLRTSFEVINKEPVQLVKENIGFEVEHFLATTAEVKSVIKNFIRPFDLSKAPLIRVGLIKIASQEHILIVDVHHIITDGVSQEVLLGDFMTLYNQQELPALTLQYKDYAEWQQREDQKRDLAKQKSFWLAEFAEETTKLELPTNFPRPLVKNFAGSSVEFELTGEETKRLQVIADKEGSTMFMIILSAFNVLLSKISNQEDIVVGTPTAGRQHAELKSMIGMFLNTLTLRNYPKGNFTFNEFLAAVKTKALECFDNQAYQYEELVDQLKVERNPGRNPLYDVRFVFQNYEKSEFKMPGLTLSSYAIEREVSQFDLTLYVEAGEQIRLSFNYSTELFKKEAVERFATYFMKIVSTITNDGNVKLADIEVISENEKQQLTKEFNNTKANYPHEKTIIDIFNDQVKNGPSNTAVVCGTEKISYQQLDVLSDALALTLKSKIKNSEVAALYVEPSLEMVIGILGILKSGLGFLPLDPTQHAQRQESILQESKTEILLTQMHLINKLTFAGQQVIIDKKNNNKQDDKVTARKKGLAYVIYTSGSTGKPKGVKINDHNVVNYAHWFKETTQLTTADKSILTSSFAFDLGYSSIFPILLSGGELHLIPTALYQAPDKLLNYISEKQITYLKLTPSLFSTFTVAPNFANKMLPSLRYIVLGGEPIQAQDLKKTKNAYSNVQFINHYGPTETTIGAVAEAIGDLEEFARQPTIGKPIYNNNVFVLDQHGKVLPLGVAGELCIAGEGVGGGYLNADELTAEKFITTPLHSGILYKTGDLARWKENGKIEFLGRIDHQIKIRGFRVELGEIENQLGRYLGVLESTVLAKENENGKYLVAYYVSAKQIDGLALKTYMSEKLPDYMVPLYYIWLKSMPLTLNGKIDRKSLPDPELTEQNKYAAPVTQKQKQLVGLWSTLMKIEEGKIGIHDDFFELGGNSIMAIRLNYNIQQLFSVELHMRQIFEYPTIEKLAKLIENSATKHIEHITRVAASESYPASSAQERLYYEHSLDKNSLTYNIANVYRLVGDLNIDKLKAAFQELLNRHESLRTGFSLTDEGNVVQVIKEKAEFELILVSADKYNTVKDAIDGFVKPFDLAAGNLMRCGLFQHKEHGHLLFLDIHHIICDGVSKNTLMNDFKRLYKGETIAPLELRYVDYASWQKNPKSSVEKQKAFWIKKLSGKLSSIDMPRLKEKDEVSDNFATYEDMSLDGELYHKIKKYTSSSNVSDYMFLLSIYYILLSKISGNTDLVVGTDVVGRTQPKLKDIVGTFVNLLPLRVQVDKDMLYKEFLDDVKECTLEAFENQDFQYDQMVAALNECGEQQSGLFDVHFALANYLDNSVQLDDLKFESVEIKWAETTHFEFKLHAMDERDRFLLHFIYNKELYDRETIQLFMKYFNNILLTVLSDNAISIENIEMESVADFVRQD